MIKKIMTITTAAVFLCFVGVIVYADSSGVFLQDNDAAMNLVDKYISSVMKNYTPDGSKISFRGIVKQGCDFWYYNAYNNKNIADKHAAGSNMEVAKAEYSIKYDSITYNNKMYTIKATVTENLEYKNLNMLSSIIKQHTIMIEQNGSEMYIINDEIDSDTISKEYKTIESAETDDSPF